MQHVVMPKTLLAERRRLGHDKRDEMWEGVLHMNEPGNFEHQDIEARLHLVLAPLADTAGLKVLLEVGVFDPLVPDWTDFRTPDVAVFEPDAASERGIEGRAALVVEVRSPGDESFEKIPFYGRVGVAELLIIDRDSKTVRRWLAGAGGPLVEVASREDGWHELVALPIALRGGRGVLEGRVDNSVQPV